MLTQLMTGVNVKTVGALVDYLNRLEPTTALHGGMLNVGGESLLLQPLDPVPIPMLIFCPNCHVQHVDHPEPDKGWDNPDHKSHTCKVHEGGCGMVFRLADVPTTGVKSIKSIGKDDTWDIAHGRT